MIWNYVAGGCLALWLLPQGTALAQAKATSPTPSPLAALPEPSAEVEQSPTEQPPTEQAPTEAPLPWAEILEGDAQQPLRVGEYNRTMATVWRHLSDQRILRYNRVQASCDALGNDMRYLRGRVSRQIEDAHRQMAPFQTEGLTAESTLDSHDSRPQRPQFSYRRADAMGVENYAEAEAILEIIRSGEDPYLYYETYHPLFSYLLNLNLDDYLDPAQDDRPLSRSEFLGYIEMLYLEWQDPGGKLQHYEHFLEASDRLIQDLLTMLREVRQSLAMLEATKAYTNIALTETPKQTLAPPSLSSPQSTLSIAQSTALTLDLDEEAFVTRRDFLLIAMLGLMMPLEYPEHPWCGGYWVERSWVFPLAQEMRQEVTGLIRDLDILNLEIMELVNTHSR